MEKKGGIKDKESFFNGLVDPDLAEDKDKSHYTDMHENTLDDVIDHLAKKVILNKYIEEEYDGSDYQKGIFLHLITDYIFFTDLLDKDYLRNTTYKAYCDDLYYSYEEIDSYLVDKYKIDYRNMKKELQENIDNNKKDNHLESTTKKNILDPILMYKFIERVSDINLEEYKEKIIKNGKNILPDC